MSVVKQIVLSLVVIAVAAAGWFLYTRSDQLFGGPAVVPAGNAGGGVQTAATPGAGAPARPASAPANPAAPEAAANGNAPAAAGGQRPGGPAGGRPDFANLTPEQRQAAFAARQAAGGNGGAAGPGAPGGGAPPTATPAAGQTPAGRQTAAATPGGAPAVQGAGAPGAGGPAGPGGNVAGGPRAGGGAGGRGGGTPTLVVTGFVETDATGTQLRTIGDLASARAVTLFPPANGVLAEVAVTAGAMVEEGTAILRLDDADQRIAVERAQLAFDDAKAAADRAEQLAKSNAITEVALATARSALARAEIDLRTAQLALDRRTLMAPFTGIVGIVAADAGDTVTAQTAVATLDDVSKLTATFAAPQAYATRLDVGAAVTATGEGAPGREITGTVTAIDTRVNDQTRTFQVVATLTDGIEGLKPGMSVVLAIDFPGEPHPAVPSQAVQWDRNGSYVWKVSGDTVQRVGVTIVSRGSGTAVVAGDLAEGDEVVVEGLQRLRAGGRITRSQPLNALLVGEQAGAGAGAAGGGPVVFQGTPPGGPPAGAVLAPGGG